MPAARGAWYARAQGTRTSGMPRHKWGTARGCHQRKISASYQENVRYTACPGSYILPYSTPGGMLPRFPGGAGARTIRELGHGVLRLSRGVRGLTQRHDCSRRRRTYESEDQDSGGQRHNRWWLGIRQGRTIRCSASSASDARQGGSAMAPQCAVSVTHRPCKQEDTSCRRRQRSKRAPSRPTTTRR